MTFDTLSNAFPVHDPEWVQDTHANHYLQSWSKQGSRPRVIVGGEGSWFWDSEGKRYLDFQSQLVNLNLDISTQRSLKPQKRSWTNWPTLAQRWPTMHAQSLQH